MLSAWTSLSTRCCVPEPVPITAVALFSAKTLSHQRTEVKEQDKQKADGSAGVETLLPTSCSVSFRLVLDRWMLHAPACQKCFVIQHRGVCLMPSGAACLSRSAARRKPAWRDGTSRSYQAEAVIYRRLAARSAARCFAAPFRSAHRLCLALHAVVLGSPQEVGMGSLYMDALPWTIRMILTSPLRPIVE